MTAHLIKPHFKATVSDLHLCQRCPRLLGYQKCGQKNAWRMGIEGSGIVYGKLFHNQIAGAFHRDAADPESPNRAMLLDALRGEPETLLARLSGMVQTCYFMPLLVERGRTLKGEQIMALAQGTERWLDCLAEFLKDVPSLATQPEAVAGSVFCRPELTLEALYPYKDGKLLRVRGRYDALLFNQDRKEAALFEFKSFQSSNSSEELSQSLAYCWLIYTATGLIPRVEMLYLEDKTPMRYPAPSVKAMLDGLEFLFEVTRRVLSGEERLPGPSDPRVCERCAFDGHCDRAWGPRDLSPSPSGSAPGAPEAALKKEALEEEGKLKMTLLLEAYRKLGAVVRSKGVVSGPAFIRLKIEPDIGKTSVSRLKKAEELQVYLGLTSPPLIQTQAGYVSVDVPRDKREILTLEGLMERAEPSRPRAEAAFPLGLDVDGNAFWVELSNPIMTSLLIGGTSGSGKSVLLRSIVAALTRCMPAGSVCFTLVDPKRVTFMDMKEFPGIDGGAPFTDTLLAMERIAALVCEMEERYEKMEALGVMDLASYNAQSVVPLQRRVILVDEYADMVVSSGDRAELEKAVQRISQKGRAAGLHLILATQRPDAKTVTPIIKANLQLRVALKVTSQRNSDIILDEGGAQNLLGHGDMLVGGSVPIRRLQGAFVKI